MVVLHVESLVARLFHETNLFRSEFFPAKSRCEGHSVSTRVIRLIIMVAKYKPMLDDRHASIRTWAIKQCVHKGGIAITSNCNVFCFPWGHKVPRKLSQSAHHKMGTKKNKQQPTHTTNPREQERSIARPASQPANQPATLGGAERSIPQHNTTQHSAEEHNTTF